MYEYYATRSIRPTHAEFGDDSELKNYRELRKNVFYRLMLPPAVFNGKRLLEFGPDTGENSLIFAQWGASLTLVEPSAETHSYIYSYFSKFGLDARLDDVVAASLLEFTAARKFDVIDAEGFIYTIQPNSVWIKKTGECLEIDGFLIISYLELYGGFVELLLKAIYHRVIRDRTYGPGIETAKRLFLPKWNSVQHTRKIESWFMDVIENPFVRVKYFIDSVSLLKDMREGGFRFYSSWPNYRDMLAMRWIKAPVDKDLELEETISFIEKSRLSHLLGSRCFLHSIARPLSDNLAALIRIIDGLIDVWSHDACIEARKCIEDIKQRVGPEDASARDKDVSAASDILKMISSVLELMQMDSADQLVEYCQSNRIFIATWGMPNHYAVFQRTA